LGFLALAKVADFPNFFSLKHFLVCVLNWGLGHASRCVPLIRRIVESGARVSLASDGDALELLRIEFPDLPCLVLPPYRIRYPFGNMTLNMALQMPRVIRAIQQEHRVVKQFVGREKVDCVISDNRYGCWAVKTPSIFLSHQLRPLIPNPLLEGPVHWGIARWLHRFDEVWIPDQPPPHALAEKLHKGFQGRPLRYLGWLSRFATPLPPKNWEYELAAILSGPEPQRTLLEEAVLRQAERIPGKLLLVRGRPSPPQHLPSNVDGCELVSGRELEVWVRKSRFLLCRSGYSSLMDLKALGRSALLVPTPGQTEQLYLAARAREGRWCVVQSQERLDLLAGLEELRALPPFASLQPPSPNWEPLDALLGS